MKKRLFLSFRAEDQNRVWGLRLLAANPNYDLEFFDESVRTAIKSANTAYIRQRIRKKIARTSITVCLISEETYQSKWVEWELEESFATGNAILAMALKGVEAAIMPAPIRYNQTDLHAWNPAELSRLIASSRSAGG